MPDYAAGKIYVIRNRQAGDGVVYVGSTTQTLCERMNGHRCGIKQRPDYKLYKLMGDVGVQHFHVELLADFPCERREQLLAEEGRHIRTLRPECNERIAGRTPKMYLEEHRETTVAYKHEWYESHKAAMTPAEATAAAAFKAARLKASRANATPEKAAAALAINAARMKAWNDAHPGVDAARQKAWHDAHPGVASARTKAYRERKAARLAAATVEAVTAALTTAAIV